MRIRIKPIFGDIPQLSQERFAFVLMPFEDNLTTIYETVVKPVVKSKGLECRRADDYQTNKEIMKDIWNAICQSQVVIAEMTGFNPNVIYHGKKKALSIFNGSRSLLLNGLIFAT